MKIHFARALALGATLLAILLGLPPSAAAQERTSFGFGGGLGSQRASATLYLREQGGDVRAAIAIEIEPGWHLYHEELGPPDAIGRPTRVVFTGGGISWSPVRFPAPHKFDQPVGLDDKPTWIYGHEGSIVLYARGRAPAGAKLDDVEARITGLTCDEECIPYNETVSSSGPGLDALFAAFPADLVVPAGASAAPGGGAGEGGSSARGGTSPTAPDPAAGAVDWEGVLYSDYEPRTALEERSLLLWLVFAFIAGVLLNVMPCVLPVVSIKVLSFVQQAGEHRSRVLALGIAFAAGILSVFLVLAGMAAFANQSWGEQFQSDTFKIVMIAVVFAFSLSLFDVYEIGVPTKVGELAAMRREGLGDAFFKGMMATALATPCSGPFLGSTLTWALSQDRLTIFAIFMAVGVGMSAPYVVLTANPALLRFVPKPGAWMQTFKHLMGFLLLFTVVFLLMSVRQDMLLYTITFLIFVGFACWLWGRYATFERTRPQRLGILAIALLLAGFGARLSFVDFKGFVSGGDSELVWQDFDPAALERYHREGRSVMVDFTADWCFNCKTNEKLVYESEPIVALLEKKDVVAMKADLTDDSPKTRAMERLRDELGARSIPFLAIFPGDDWRRPYTMKDIVTRAEVATVLESLP